MKTKRQLIINTIIIQTVTPVTQSHVTPKSVSHPPTLASPEPETNVYPEVIHPTPAASNLYKMQYIYIQVSVKLDNRLSRNILWRQ